MTIGRLARRVGVAPSAIRYYEARGLLRASTRLPNGYRRYDEGAVATLGFIRRAQSFGMTLDEVRDLLRLAAHGNPPCARVREIARAHLGQVRAQIRELVALQRELARLLRRRPDRAQNAHICPLLEQGGGSHPRIADTHN